MDKVEFSDEDQKRIHRILCIRTDTYQSETDYLLVTEDEDGDSDALYFKRYIRQEDEDAVYDDCGR